MKILFILAIGVIAVLILRLAMLVGVLEFKVERLPAEAQSPKANVTNVADLLDQATRAGDPPAPGTPAERLNTECAKRERRLMSLPRPTRLTDIAPHAQRVLAVLHAHSRRSARLGAPREVRNLNREQEQTVVRLARAARAGNYRAAQAQAMALRELAGRANTELMRLGLTQCVLRASGMPL